MYSLELNWVRSQFSTCRSDDSTQLQSIEFRFEGCKPQGISGHIDVNAIASDILFFWSSCTKLQVRHTGRDSTSWDVRQGELNNLLQPTFDEELSFSHKGKDVWFEWVPKACIRTRSGVG